MTSPPRKILLHTCCAHCLAKLLAGIHEITTGPCSPLVHWYNPNIHPLIEYRRRLKATKILCERARLPLVADETYGLLPFLRTVQNHENPGDRCPRCYALRLDRAAATAAANNCPQFTTTLITSTHQDHALIRAAGEAAAARHHVAFLYRDLRTATPPQKLVHSLYKQQYCGCIFSEYDRFHPTITHLYPPPRPTRPPPPQPHAPASQSPSLPHG